jgi:hypothetical protein
MIRKLLIAGAVGLASVIGYVIGVRAGFDVGVRDYVENNAEMLDKVAVEKDKFNYPEDVDCSGEREGEGEKRTDVSATFQ